MLSWVQRRRKDWSECLRHLLLLRYYALIYVHNHEILTVNSTINHEQIRSWELDSSSKCFMDDNCGYIRTQLGVLLARTSRTHDLPRFGPESNFPDHLWIGF